MLIQEIVSTSVDAGRLECLLSISISHSDAKSFLVTTVVLSVNQLNPNLVSSLLPAVPCYKRKSLLLVMLRSTPA